MVPRINLIWKGQKQLSHIIEIASPLLFSLFQFSSSVQPFLVYFLYHPQPIQPVLSPDVMTNHTHNYGLILRLFHPLTLSNIKLYLLRWKKLQIMLRCIRRPLKLDTNTSDIFHAWHTYQKVLQQYWHNYKEKDPQHIRCHRIGNDRWSVEE